MFQPRTNNGEIVGHEYKTPHAIFFFGTKHATQELLPMLYPELKFAFLKQVHGREVLWANPQAIQTADGHATQDRKLAVVVQTADCVPVLLAGENHAIALHAGWRGIAAQIIQAAADFTKNKQTLSAAIGPHIGAKSFEVGNDVAVQLSEVSHGATQQVVLSHPDLNKKYVDLRTIAKRQLEHAFNPSLKIHTVDGDTLTSPLYHSYRRGKNRGERQFSFVALV